MSALTIGTLARRADIAPTTLRYLMQNCHRCLETSHEFCPRPMA